MSAAANLGRACGADRCAQAPARCPCPQACELPDASNELDYAGAHLRGAEVALQLAIAAWFASATLTVAAFIVLISG